MRFWLLLSLLLVACSHRDRGGLYRFDGDGRLLGGKKFETLWTDDDLPPHRIQIPVNLTTALVAHERIRQRRSPKEPELEAVIKRLVTWSKTPGNRPLPRDFRGQRLAGFDGFGNVQFTGYYSPVIEAARQRSEAYPYPLYRHPPEWDPKGTYLTRQQIDEDGGLEGLGLEIAWTADRMSNFFLHVQGSGYVQFKDGERILLAYGGKNGHQYTSIGRLLVERGAISKSEISMQAIKAWAEKHPEEVSELLYQCKSYTFFRTGPVGPIGAGGEVVVSHLSVAVDPKVIPLGAVLLAKVPQLNSDGHLTGHGWRILLAQDKGAAIKGPGHIDLYLGVGDEAGRRAGRLHHYGSVWMLRGPLPSH